MSSGAGRFPHPHLWAYGVSKAGICFLAETAAEELGPLGIRVNAVAPGIIDDELMSFITAGGPLLDDYLAQMPLGRVGTVEDVAAAVRYLIGPESSFVTGETLGVDGGHHLRRGADYSLLFGLGRAPVQHGSPAFSRIRFPLALAVIRNDYRYRYEHRSLRTAGSCSPAHSACPSPAFRTGLGPRADASAATAAVVHVVAAENFWGNITSQLGGHDVQVTSLITNPNADPHLFETSAADAATLAQAQGRHRERGRLRHLDESLLSADNGHPRIVVAASVLHVTGSDPNPHLWYDIPRVPTVAAAITAALGQGGAAGRVDLPGQPRAASTHPSSPSMPRLATIKKSFHNVPVAYTERVPGYALAVADLDVKTPPGFARSIEDGVDPGPTDTLAMRAAPHEPRHQRAPLQRADGDPGHDPDPHAGPAARHPRGRSVRDHAGRSRHLPEVAAVAADRSARCPPVEPEPVTDTASRAGVGLRPPRPADALVRPGSDRGRRRVPGRARPQRHWQDHTAQGAARPRAPLRRRRARQRRAAAPGQPRPRVRAPTAGLRAHVAHPWA